MQALQVGTRKGLFILQRAASGWRLGQPHFAGEPVTQVAVDPADGTCYAALRLGHFGVKLKRSTGGGRLWAGALPAGLFVSADRGESWRLVESLWDRPERRDWLGGGYDHAGI